MQDTIPERASHSTGWYTSLCCKLFVYTILGFVCRGRHLKLGHVFFGIWWVQNLDLVIQSLLACSQNIFPLRKSLQTSDKRLEGAKHPCSKPDGHMFSTLELYWLCLLYHIQHLIMLEQCQFWINAWEAPWSEFFRCGQTMVVASEFT